MIVEGEPDRSASQASHVSDGRRHLAFPAPVERTWDDHVADEPGWTPGHELLDRIERAVVFAMREASRMKVDGS